MALSSEKTQARRAFLIGAAALGTLVVAGCSTGPRRGPETPPPPSQQTPEQPEGPIAEGERLGVAVLVPLSGDNGAVGTSISNAAKMALLDSKNESIRLTIYDTAVAGGARAAANSALADGNALILGPLLSENVRLVAPAARQKGVPVIAFSNDEEVAGDGVYIMGFTPSQSIARTVRYAKGQGASTFAAMVPTGEYGQRAGQAFLRSVEAADGRAVTVESFNRSPEAIQGALSTLAARGEVDAVLVADSGRVAAYAAPRIRTGTRILGTELWAAENNLGQTAALRGALYSSVPSTRFDQLQRRYRARYGRVPYRLASLGYDGMLLAVRAAQTWRPGQRFPSVLLRADDGFVGVDGIFRFGRDGVAQRALEVRQVTAGGFSVVDAAPSRF